MQRGRIIKVKDLELPELRIFSNASENELLRINEPQPGLFMAEGLKVVRRALDAGYEPVAMLAGEKELQGAEDEGKAEDPDGMMQVLSRMPDIPVYTAPRPVLDEITGFSLTGGVLCAMKRRTLPSPSEVCGSVKRLAVLEGVMNPVNTGSIFRAAAALNMDAVLLSPGCCDPLYRRAIRVSMGTVFQIPWTVFPGKAAQWPERGMSWLKEQGFWTVAMALRKDTIQISDPALKAREKMAVLMGSEGYGLSETTIDAADDTVCIPMSHGVDSLNVAGASALAFWELGQRGF